MINTWLPLPNFSDSVESLSNEHLRIQRLHVLDIVEHIHDVEISELPDNYVKHNLDGHPVVLMWTGYELQLCEYGLIACEEWQRRTGNSDLIYAILTRHQDWAVSDDADMTKPNWFGDVDFHLSHQAWLLRHDYQHYSKLFMDDGDKDLVWPVSNHAS